ncbi:MAG: class I SAM-dependent methyltransferase [Bryobacter sp.]|nr:class I SAM-dependent methyltransferase [Bryobacter sp.]
MQANPFVSESMAAGYAQSRPPVHREIVRHALRQPTGRVLDVGCGAGFSTAALAGWARHAVGLEPAEPMLAWGRQVAPSGDFVVGRGECLPFPASTFGGITAAGSLNYANPAQSLAEARRVLEPGGWLLAYDFSAGRRLAGYDETVDPLAAWFAKFQESYPPPQGEAIPLDPETIAALVPEMALARWERMEVRLPLDRNFYLNYMLTETNVAAAVRRGLLLGDIRHWCENTLAQVWEASGSIDGPRDILFRGYYVVLTK